MANKNLINSVLCCLNPRMQITPTHYVCGKNLAFFASLAQIESCLTGFTNNCKCLISNKGNCLRDGDDTKK
ncbi:MAG: hypothetical protein IJ272_01485 [Clostridia bacterium]|nr:hypothetical protein [Clostridia bacterium]